MIKTDNEPRNTWPMGKVIEVHPDKAGSVRSALLKTQLTKLVRPVQKLVLLLPVKA